MDSRLILWEGQMEFNQIPGHKMSFPMQLIDEQDKICLPLYLNEKME